MFQILSKRHLLVLKNEQGVSLTSVITGAAIAAIVTFGATSVYIQTKKSESLAFAKDSFEQSHEAAVNVFRSTRAVQNLVYSSPPFKACLEGNYKDATGCMSWNNRKILLTPTTPEFSFSNVQVTAGTGIQSKAEGSFARLYPTIAAKIDRSGKDCSANPSSCYIEVQSFIEGLKCDLDTRCSAVRFTVETKRLAGPNSPIAGSMKDKVTQISYPAIALIAQSRLEFNKNGCAITSGSQSPDNTYTTGLSYEKRTADCLGPVAPTGPPPFIECTNQRPMNTYYQPGTNDCADLVTVTGCSEGVQGVGVFSGQGSCTPTPN